MDWLGCTRTLKLLFVTCTRRPSTLGIVPTASMVTQGDEWTVSFFSLSLSFDTALNANPNENKLTKLIRWLCNDTQSSKFIFKLTSARFVVTLCNLSTVDLFLAADQCVFCRSAFESIDFNSAIALNGSDFVSFYIISIIFFESQGSSNTIFNSIQLRVLRCSTNECSFEIRSEEPLHNISETIWIILANFLITLSVEPWHCHQNSNANVNCTK